MKRENESYLEVKKSKFYGYLYNINDYNEIDVVLNEIKKENPKARHIVYAYKFGSLEKNYSDKEPNKTTFGLLNTIKNNNLDKTLIVVVRYFGGTLLGSGLLFRTYNKASNMLIKK